MSAIIENIRIYTAFIMLAWVPVAQQLGLGCFLVSEVT